VFAVGGCDLIDKPIGAALNRDIAPAEQVEWQIDAFISMRHDKRIKEEGERREEEAWKESTRRAEAARDEKLREEWSEYHRRQARVHKSMAESLVRYHEQQAAKYLKKGA
jgi:hypothetical protein